MKKKANIKRLKKAMSDAIDQLQCGDATGALVTLKIELRVID